MPTRFKMTIYNRFLLLILLAFAVPAKLKAAFYIANGRAKTEIPFQWVNNLIILELNVNGTLLHFILDSGVNESLILNLDNKELDLHQSQTITFSGLGKGGSVQGLATYQNLVQIEQTFVDTNHTFFVMLQEDFQFIQHLGLPVHGVIGYEFFKNHVIAIDFERQKIKLFDHLEDVPRLKRYRQLPLTLIKNKPYTTLDFSTSGRLFRDNMMLIDLGNTDAVWIFEQELSGFEFQSEVMDDYLGRGFSGDITGRRGRIQCVSWPGALLEQVIVAAPDTASLHALYIPPGRKGSVGVDLLSRFDLVLDYRAGQFFIKKNKFFSSGFRINMSGMDLVHDGEQLLKRAIGYAAELPFGRKATQSGTLVLASEENREFLLEWRPSYTVYKVRQNSPAYDAGVRTGDRILKINGRTASSYKMDQIYALLSAGEEKWVRLEVVRNDDADTLHLKLKLRDPLRFHPTH